MTSTAVVAISRRGSGLARKLTSSLEGEVTLYLERRFHQEGEGAVAYQLPVAPLLQRLFLEHRQLVLFMPVGAAMRLLAPCLKDKHDDPAVVCVDDAGRFAVSLLSGHLGGADHLAQEVARTLGSTPVITSASLVTGTLAVDLLGHEFGWQIDSKSEVVTRASAAVINEEPVGILQEAGEREWWSTDRLPANVSLYSSPGALMAAKWAAALIITDRQAPMANDEGRGGSLQESKPVVYFRPRTLVAGMGCRRGVSMDELEELLLGAFDSHNLAHRSLRCIATAELKRDEPGIQELADKYSVPVLYYKADELNSVFEERNLSSPDLNKGGTGQPHVIKVGERPTPRPRVRQLLGMWGVSEPAALLAAGSRELLVPRAKTGRATIAVARVEFSGNPPRFATESQRSQS